MNEISEIVATYRYAFDHLQELTGRHADQVIQGQKTAVAQAS